MIPDPLHPAVVHFPIALILVGFVGALVSMIWSRGCLPWFVAGILVLGASGAGVAFWTGGEAGEQATGIVGFSHAAAVLLRQHDEWAERTLIVAGVAAVFALAAAATGRWVNLSTGLRLATLLAAAAAAFCVFQTAHRGGQLVYQHGVGMKVPSTVPLERKH